MLQQQQRQHSLLSSLQHRGRGSNGCSLHGSNGCPLDGSHGCLLICMCAAAHQKWVEKMQKEKWWRRWLAASLSSVNHFSAFRLLLTNARINWRILAGLKLGALWPAWKELGGWGGVGGRAGQADAKHWGANFQQTQRHTVPLSLAHMSATQQHSAPPGLSQG